MNNGSDQAGSQTDPRAIRTKTQILAAARQLILDEGPDAVTPTRLSQITGIARSTIYRQWTQPADIIFEATAADTDAPPFTPSGDLERDLTAYLEALRTMLGTHQATLTATQIERAEHSPEAAELLSRVAADRRALIARLLGEDEHDFSEEHALIIGPLMFQRLLARQPISDKLIQLIVDAYVRTRPTDSS